MACAMSDLDNADRKFLVETVAVDKSYATKRETIHVLKEAHLQIFTGEVWEAQRAKELGLIDGIGHLEPVLKERYGQDIKFKKLDRKRGIFSKFGKASVDGIIDAVNENVHFAKFRL